MAFSVALTADDHKSGVDSIIELVQTPKGKASGSRAAAGGGADGEYAPG
jgi:hypothetical protein